MEDQLATAEPSQQFENIDFNSSPEDNYKESSNNDEEQNEASNNTMEDISTDEHSDFFIEITVSEPQKMGEGMGSYLAYKVTTHTSIPKFKVKQFSTMRRFSDLLGLHDLLVSKYLRLGRIIPPAPEKYLIGTTKVKMSAQTPTEPGNAHGLEWIENRRAALERFLCRTSQHPVLCLDADFINFLQSNEELPRASNTSTLSGAGVMRLFNRFGETVNKITYKMDENDPWFQDKICEIENLDNNLQKLHSALKALVHNRKELSGLTGAVAKSAALLSTCEEHTGLSRALSQLADTEEKVELLRSEQDNSDLFILTEIIKDYLGLIGAIKDAFHELGAPERKYTFRIKITLEKPIWIKSHSEYVKTFYDQADFGYIRNQINELMVLCTPLFPNDSMLECSKNLRFCHGRNIMINFTDLASEKQQWRYRMDVLKEGQIGGYCKLNKDLFNKQMDHMSALQSWAPELRNFVEFDERPIDEHKCDMVYEKPVYIMKIDATSNMYHHFCDFFNLYASLHVNMTHPKAFDTDNYIFLWETYNYVTPFSVAFKAFTKNPIFTIRAWAGKTVCFKNLMLPLLPRMIFGLYYNTPIINGCQNSGLFQSFSDFILHRLNIPLHRVENEKIRITFLERKTKFRQILNSDELVAELRKNQSYSVRTVRFERTMQFVDQLEIVRNTDIFIGIHGAGLSHLLFLPKWATLFELYNCEDSECYKDLARLRGVNYITWENRDKLGQQDEGHHPSGGAHAKFTNYSFDKVEFSRLVDKAADYVLNHQEYKNFVLYNFGNIHDEL